MYYGALHHPLQHQQRRKWFDMSEERQKGRPEIYLLLSPTPTIPARMLRWQAAPGSSDDDLQNDTQRSSSVATGAGTRSIHTSHTSHYTPPHKVDIGLALTCAHPLVEQCALPLEMCALHLCSALVVEQL